MRKLPFFRHRHHFPTPEVYHIFLNKQRVPTCGHVSWFIGNVTPNLRKLKDVTPLFADRSLGVLPVSVTQFSTFVKHFFTSRIEIVHHPSNIRIVRYAELIRFKYVEKNRSVFMADFGSECVIILMYANILFGETDFKVLY